MMTDSGAMFPRVAETARRQRRRRETNVHPTSSLFTYITSFLFAPPRFEPDTHTPRVSFPYFVTRLSPLFSFWLHHTVPDPSGARFVFGGHKRQIPTSTRVALFAAA